MDRTAEFEYTIAGRPDFSLLTVQLPVDRSIKVEAAAMAAMDTNVNMKTQFRGGLGRLVTGENIFVNEFTAEGGPAEVLIAPAAPGDLEHVYLDNNTIFLQSKAFVASGLGVAVETKWQGMLKGFFSGAGLFLLRCSGVGDLFFNAFGALNSFEIDGTHVVDNGHVVAFTEGLEYEIDVIAGYKSFFFSGEGLVCRFRGHGRVWVQTRQLPAFAAWMYPYRPSKR